MMLLITRIGYIQLIQGEKLQQLAYQQQSLNRKINPKRGTIYDSSKKYILAVSSTVYTVTVNPTNIMADDKEKISRALSDIFEQDYEQVLKKIKKRSSIETIVRKVEKAKTDELVSSCKEQAALEPQYGEPWIVFDRDRVVRFDEIIKQANELAATRAMVWPLFYTGVFYLIFVGFLTIVLGKVEKKLSYFRS